MDMVASSPTYSVGDIRRPAMGRAVLSTCWLAGTFLIYIWTAKEVRPIYTHVPWADDPYDAVISFALFFVPLVAALCAARASLCRTGQPLPSSRARELLLASRLLTGIIAFTLTTEWISVADGQHRSAWTGTTLAAVAALAGMSFFTSVVGFHVIRALRASAPTPDAGTPGWWPDIAQVLDSLAGRLGPISRPARRSIAEVDNRLMPLVSSHAMASWFAVSLVFGVFVATSQAVGEGGLVPEAILLFFVVATSSMFAFLLAIGRHLHLLGTVPQTSAHARRLADAMFGGAAAIPFTLATRGALNPLIALVPLHPAIRIITVGIVLGLLVGTAVYVVECLLGSYDRVKSRAS